jgi:hypothetical protein
MTGTERAIERGRLEIMADMAAGIVPRTVRSFAALHDYVDANEYGGLCDFPLLPAADAELVQSALDAWLRGPRCSTGGTTPSECSMMRERDAAGRSDTIADCPVHGAYMGEP